MNAECLLPMVDPDLPRGRSPVPESGRQPAWPVSV